MICWNQNWQKSTLKKPVLEERGATIESDSKQKDDVMIELNRIDRSYPTLRYAMVKRLSSISSIFALCTALHEGKFTWRHNSILSTMLVQPHNIISKVPLLEPRSMLIFFDWTIGEVQIHLMSSPPPASAMIFLSLFMRHKTYAFYVMELTIPIWKWTSRMRTN